MFGAERHNALKRNTFYLLVLAGLAIRLVLLARYDLFAGTWSGHALSADAAVGLVGKSIAQTGVTPHLTGPSLDPWGLDAYVAATSFSLFGVGAIPLRLIPFVLSLVLAILVYRFFYVHYSVATARWATALVAVAPVGFLQSSLQAHGAVSAHAIFLLAAMLLFWRFSILRERRMWIGLVLGAGAVAAVYLHARALWYVALMVGILALQQRDRRGLLSLAVGAAVAAALLVTLRPAYLPHAGPSGLPGVGAAEVVGEPLVAGAMTSSTGRFACGDIGRSAGFACGLRRLASVFGVPAPAASERGGFFAALLGFLWPISLLVFGVSLAACRPRRGRWAWGPVGSDQVLGLLVLATILVGWAARGSMASVYPLAAGSAGVLCSRLVGTRRRWMVAGVAVVMVFQVATWADAWVRGPDRKARADGLLLRKLDELRVDRCFSVQPLYDVAFTSRERVIIAPLRRSHFPAYDRAVLDARHLCYVFEDDQAEDPVHLAMSALLGRRVAGQRSARAGDFTILYDLRPNPVLSAADLAKVRRARAGRDTLVGMNSGHPRTIR